MRRGAGVEAVIEQLYDVVRGCDPPEMVEQLLSEDLTTIGTDEEEWETDHAAVAGFLAQTQTVGVLTVRAESSRGYSDGLFGWFEDRALVTFADGESAAIRLPGAARHQNGRWRLVQLHTSRTAARGDTGTRTAPPPPVSQSWSAATRSA